MFFSKTFANISVPGTPAFVGEIVLAIGLLEYFRPPYWERQLLHTSPDVRLALVLLAATGIRFSYDYPRFGIDAVRDFAMIYYMMFGLLSAAACFREPLFLQRLLVLYWRVLPAFIVWAPIAILLGEVTALSSLFLPGTSVPVNSFKPGDISVLVAMAVTFVWVGGKRVVSRRTDHSSATLTLTVLGLLALLIGATQTRGGFLASVVALTIAVAYLPAGRRRRLGLSTTGAMLLVVALLLLLDVRIPNPDREVSLQTVATNVGSIVTRDNERLDGTVKWRENLWQNVTDDMRQSGAWTVGLGFGPVLGQRYGTYGVDGANGLRPLRNVHNSHLTVFARTGMVGMVLWGLLWGVWFYRLHRWIRNRPRRLGDANAAIGVWLLSGAAGFLVNAYFDPAIEGPQGAVWLYVVFGLGAVLTGSAEPPFPAVSGTLTGAASPADARSDGLHRWHSTRSARAHRQRHRL